MWPVSGKSRHKPEILPASPAKPSPPTHVIDRHHPNQPTHVTSPTQDLACPSSLASQCQCPWAMDPSTNSTMNGAQHANTPSYTFLDELSQYADTNSLASGDDFSSFFDPALFESTTIGPGFSQQAQPIPQNSFNQNVQRQSNSPGLPQPQYNHNQNQPSFSHSQYSQQPVYNGQSLSQPNYDPRYYPRPSASPVNFEAYNYQPPMNFANQTYSPQQMNMPPRQTATPTNYPANQQQPLAYVNIGQRPSQLPQAQVKLPSSIDIISGADNFAGSRHVAL